MAGAAVHSGTGAAVVGGGKGAHTGAAVTGGKGGTAGGALLPRRFLSMDRELLLCARLSLETCRWSSPAAPQAQRFSATWHRDQ